jgi:endonuclease YncB( thermonuclease family)
MSDSIITRSDQRVITDDWRSRATVVAGYDGDTFKAVLDLGMRSASGTSKDPIPIRFNGIDTPEMNDPSPAIRAKAVRARDFVAERLKPGDPKAPYVLLYTFKTSENTDGEKTLFDGRGRLLADVYYQKAVRDKKVGRKIVREIEWGFLNDELVAARLAKRIKDKRAEWTEADASE